MVLRRSVPMFATTVLLATVVTAVAAPPASAVVEPRVLVPETDHLPLVGDDSAVGQIVDIDRNRAITLPSTLHERDQTGTWVAVGELTPVSPDGGTIIQTSGAVLAGDRAVVSVREIPPGGGSRGVLYVFDLSQDRPVQVQTILRPVPGPDAPIDGFADSFDVVGNVLVANDPRSDVATTVWSYVDTGAGFANPTEVEPGTYAVDGSWGFDLSMSEQRLIVRDDSPGTAGGGANETGIVVFELVGGETWTFDTVLRGDVIANPGSIRDADVDDDRVVIGHISRGPSSRPVFTVHERDGGGAWSQVDEVDIDTSGPCCSFDRIVVDGEVVVAAATQVGVSGPTPPPGSFSIFERDAGTWSLVESQVSSDPGDGFARSVAVDAGRVLVGHPGADESGFTNNGAGLLFAAEGGWAQVDTLLGQRAEGGQGLGTAVTVDGSGLAFHGSNIGGTPYYEGAVALVRDAGGNWRQDLGQSRTPLEEDSGPDAIALSDDLLRLVVGVPVDNAPGTTGLGNGRVYVYERTSVVADWVLQTTLDAPDPVTGNNFGSHLALEGDLLVVGAQANGVGGGAYAFRDSGAGFVFDQKVYGGDNDTGSGIAVNAVRVHDGEIYVGDALAPSNGGFAGPGAVFRYVDGSPDTGDWTLEQTIQDRLDGTGGFGRSFDVTDAGLVVGADREAEVSLFRDEGAGFVKIDTLTGDFDDRFGEMVAMNDGGDILVAATGRSRGADELVGAIDFVQLDPDSDTLSVSQSYQPDLPADARFGTRLELDGDYAIVGAPSASFPGRPSAGALELLRLSSEPVAIDDGYGLVTGGTLTVDAADGVLDNDLNPQSDDLEVVLIDDVADGTLTLEQDGSFVYAPDPGFADFDTFTYRIRTDRPTTSNVATVSIRVTRPPTAADDEYATAKNQLLTVLPASGLLTNDTDPDNDGLTVQSIGSASSGTVTQVGPAGGFTFQPANNVTGTATFSYVLTDGVATDTGSVTITVTDVPIAANDGPYEATEDTSLVVPVGEGVLVNDVSVPNGRVLTAQVVAQPTKGSVALAQNGSFTYTPDPDEFGADQFTYRARDGAAASNTATVSIDIEAAPDPEPDSFIADEGRTTQVSPPGVLANDVGTDLTAELVTPTTTEGVVVDLDEDGSFTVLVPDDLGDQPVNQPFSDFFTYRAVEDGVASEEVRVDLRLNRAPVGGLVSYDLGNDETISRTAGNGLGSLRTNDEDGDAVTFSLVGGDTPFIQVGLDGSFTYRKPFPGFVGREQFEYRVSDGRLAAPAFVSFSVGEIEANDDTYRFNPGETLEVLIPDDLLANDIAVFSNPTVELEQAPSGGTVQGIDAGPGELSSRFRYVPDPGTTQDSFRYRITDGSGTDTATVTLTANRAPVGQPDTLSVAFESTTLFTLEQLTANDRDPDGDTINVNFNETDFEGGFIRARLGEYSLITDEGFRGTTSFTYTPVDDLGLEGDPVTVTVNVGTDPTVGPGPGVPIDPDAPDQTVRCAGESRIDTAVCISQLTFADAGGDAATARVGEVGARLAAGAVVLARADDFADALAGTPFADTKDAPLLLTATEALPEATAAEIGRVLAPGGTVWILGGTAAVSASVLDGLVAEGYDVQRLGGESRFDTAVVLADATTDDPGAVFLVTARNFADAVAAGPAAIREGGVILLTNNDTPTAETDAYLARSPEAVRYAVGGPAARAYPDADELFVGESRIDTALQVSTRFFVDDGVGPVVVGLARADNFPDALAGGVRMGQLAGPILLVFPTALPDEVDGFLSAYADDIRVVEIYGGINAVSDEVEAAVLAAIR